MSDIFNTMQARVNALKQNSDYLDGEISIANIDELDGELIVASVNHNKMFAKVEVIPPPLTDTTVPSLYDTFIRSDMPVVPYGTNQGMYVGNKNGGTYKSLIRFDIINALPSKMIVTKAIMKLHAINYDSTMDINLSTVDRMWQENNITWQAGINPVDLIETKQIKAGESYIEFDVTQYVKNCRQNGQTNNGFILESLDNALKGFYTKESTAKPELTLTYYDSTLKNIGVNSALYGEINVIKQAKAELNGEINIKFAYGTGLEVLDGEITVSQNQIVGEINIQQKNELMGEINVFNNELSELDGELTVSQDQISGEIVVSSKIELDGEITVNLIKNVELDGEINTYIIGENELTGVLPIANISNLDGEIDVILKRNSELDGEINIYKTGENELLGELPIANFGYLDGEINSIIQNKSELDGELIVSQNQILGELIVGSMTELDGEINVVIQDKAELDSEINIFRLGQDELLGEIQPAYKTELDGEISTYIIGKDELEGELNSITQNELVGQLCVSYQKDLQGEIKVVLPHIADLIGEINILFQDDLEGEINVSQKDEFEGYVFIM